MTERTVLITGGAGFIGSNIAWHLGRAGDAVTVCDTLGTGDKWRNLLGAPIAAIVPPEHLAATLERTEFGLVVHMGAISSTAERDADAILRTNVDLSLRLWDYCAARRGRFLYASSAAVYGDGGEGFDDDPATAALMRLRPRNPYGWSKLLFDRLVARRLAAGAPAPAQWAGLRFFNVYGPHEHHKGEMRSVVFKAFEQVRDGEAARLFRSYRDGVPDGRQTRDFIHVDDCARVVDWLIANPAVSGLFNLGTGVARSWLDLAGAVFAAMGKEPRITFVDMPPPLRAHYQYATQAEMGRLRDAGYRAPFLTLEDGVRRYVTEFLATGWPYR